jgi:hypothetical protein
MKRTAAATVAAVALMAPATWAHAGIYSDELARCVVKASSPTDQVVLVTWIFSAMSIHPAVQPYSKVTQAQRDEFDKKAGALFERLITQDCRQQSIDAIKYEGEAAMEASFSVLGQVAMRNMMSDPAVQAGLGGMAKNFDQSKFEALAKEAGITTGASAPAKPK